MTEPKKMWERELDSVLKQLVITNETSDDLDGCCHQEHYDGEFSTMHTTSDSDFSDNISSRLLQHTRTTSESSSTFSCPAVEDSYFQNRLNLFDIQAPSRQMIEVVQNERMVYNEMCLLLDNTFHLTKAVLTSPGERRDDAEDREKPCGLSCGDDNRFQLDITALKMQLIEIAQENDFLRKENASLFYQLNGKDRYTKNELIDELVGTKLSLALALSEIEEEKLHRFKIIRAVSKLL